MDVATGWTFARALTRALIDSEQTADLLTGEEISSVGRMEALLPMMRSTEEGRRILAERPRISTHTVDFAALRRLPPGRLGREFADHLARHRLDPDALTVTVTRGRTALHGYLLERVRQTHDIWHTLLSLGVAGYEEVLVHAFQWPQLRMPYSALVVGFGTLKHVLGERRWAVMRHGLRSAMRAGASAQPLLPVRWEARWDEPIDAIRARLGIVPATRWAGVARSGT